MEDKSTLIDEFIITRADNGLMLTSKDWVQVIEDTHSNDSSNDNIVEEIGKLFHDMIKLNMDCLKASIIKVKIESTKVDI